MFTFTFYKHDSMDKTVVAGAKYSIESRDSFRIVTVFPRNGEGGECFYLDRAKVHPVSRPSFRSLFVTSEGGKTIDRVEPPADEVECERPRTAILEG